MYSCSSTHHETIWQTEGRVPLILQQGINLNTNQFTPVKKSLGTHSIWGCVAVSASYEEKRNIFHLSGMELGSSVVQSVD